MSANDLEDNDDLDHVTLVRMEDVQPEKTELYLDDEMIENLEYDNECVIDDRNEDCAIGSMVPIKWEEVEDSQDTDTDCASEQGNLESADDSNDTAEYIIPDITKSNVETKEKIAEISNQSPSSWPTLEILPGGVIKDADKYEDMYSDKNRLKNNEMVYACAKCSQKYKHLYCLVRHVKWHEDEEKKLKNSVAATVTPTRSLLKPIKNAVQPKKDDIVQKVIYKLKCAKNTKIQKFPKRTKHKTNNCS
ncbi:uncharacterized protein LOC121737961 [Aricia agestis]|uniref:uncharacterized protein LOC121737961 n=1 Tax=Aricia agestis TaxID=91739 RepID=UPI001C20A4DA|nr:uncharacterized protein LOC121737961 [Aricia agestis]